MENILLWWKKEPFVKMEGMWHKCHFSELKFQFRMCHRNALVNFWQGFFYCCVGSGGGERGVKEEGMYLQISHALVKCSFKNLLNFQQLVYLSSPLFTYSPTPPPPPPLPNAAR
jgi:hypothetical protein